jgi:hypothetical protein
MLGLPVATVLLLGVLAIGYGYFHPSRSVLYAGMLLTVAGVITGVVRILTHNTGGGAGT